MTLHLFNATCSPSNTFSLRQAAVLCAKECLNTVKNLINHSFYADNCLLSTAMIKKAIELIKEVYHVLSKHGFILTKWIINDERILQSVPVDKMSKVAEPLSLDDLSGEQVSIGILQLMILA